MMLLVQVHIDIIISGEIIMDLNDMQRVVQNFRMEKKLHLVSLQIGLMLFQIIIVLYGYHKILENRELIIDDDEILQQIQMQINSDHVQMGIMYQIMRNGKR